MTKKERGHPYIELVDVVLDSINVESIAQGNKQVLRSTQLVHLLIEHVAIQVRM